METSASGSKKSRKDWREYPSAKKATEYQRAYRARHPETMKAKYHRDNLRKKFGMTPEQYAEILEVQGGGCAICGVSEEDNGRKLAVDHDHVSGAVRGILCRKCNWSLGQFDRDDLLFRVMDYLARFPHSSEDDEWCE